MEIFPELLRAAGSDPAAPLLALAAHGYELLVGFGEGHGGRLSRRAAHELATAGFRRADDGVGHKSAAVARSGGPRLV